MGEEAENIFRGLGELPELSRQMIISTTSTLLEAKTGGARGTTYRGPVWIVSGNVTLAAEPEDALLED